MLKRLLQSILFLWELLCLALFFYGVGQRSGVHLFSFEGFGWATIQFTNINFGVFFTALIKSFLGAILFSLSAIGFGMAFIKAIDREKIATEKGWAIVVTAFALGQSIFSLFVLVSLVATQQLASLYTFAVVSIGLIFLLVYIAPRRRQILVQAGNMLSFLRLSGNIPVSLSIIVFGLTLLYSSSRLSYDAATQYFAHAKIIALSERLVLLSFKDVFVGSALYLTGLYAAVIQLFGDQAARIYSWINGLAILASCIMVGEKVGLSRRARMLFLAFPLTTTAFVDLLGDGKIDLANASVILVAAYWFLQSFQRKSKFSFLITGFLTGFSIVARTYNAILLGIFFSSIFLFYFYAQKEDRKTFFKSLVGKFLRLSLPSLSFWVASYLVVNALVLQNPLAPLSVFGLNANDWPFYPTGAQAAVLLLLYPFSITFTGMFDTLGFISPLFLAFLPNLFVKDISAIRPFSKELVFVSFSSLLALYLWVGIFGTIHILEVRYVLFLWFLLFLLIAQLVDNAMRLTFFSKVRIQAILSAILLFMALRVILISFATYSPFDKDSAPDCRDLPMCTFFEPINRLANPGDRVLVLGGYRYYLRPDLFACSSTGDEYLALENAVTQSSDEFWREVRRQGYRFIVYDSFYNAYILRLRSLPDLHNFPDGLRISVLYDKTFKDYDGRDVTESVYRIDSAQFGQLSRKTCIFDEGKWKIQTRK